MKKAARYISSNMCRGTMSEHTTASTEQGVGRGTRRSTCSPSETPISTGGRKLPAQLLDQGDQKSRDTRCSNDLPSKTPLVTEGRILSSQHSADPLKLLSRRIAGSSKSSGTTTTKTASPRLTTNANVTSSGASPLLPTSIVQPTDHSSTAQLTESVQSTQTFPTVSEAQTAVKGVSMKNDTLPGAWADTLCDIVSLLKLRSTGVWVRRAPSVEGV